METNRGFIRCISRIRCQHALFPKHESRIGLRENDSCGCGEMGDIEHHILGCLNHTINVKTLYENLNNMIEYPFNIETIMSSSNVIVYKILYNFIIERKTRI